MSEAERYLELCDKAVEDLEKGEEAGQSLRARYNRLYYACFYAAKAALLSKDIEVRSHAGIADKVFTELYKEQGSVEKKTAAVLSRVQTKRDQSDYEIDINETEKDYQEIKEKAEILNDVKERSDE